MHPPNCNASPPAHFKSSSVSPWPLSPTTTLMQLQSKAAATALCPRIRVSSSCTKGHNPAIQSHDAALPANMQQYLADRTVWKSNLIRLLGSLEQLYVQPDLGIKSPADHCINPTDQSTVRPPLAHLAITPAISPSSYKPSHNHGKTSRSHSEVINKLPPHTRQPGKAYTHSQSSSFFHSTLASQSPMFNHPKGKHSS